LPMSHCQGNSQVGLRGREQKCRFTRARNIWNSRHIKENVAAHVQRVVVLKGESVGPAQWADGFRPSDE